MGPYVLKRQQAAHKCQQISRQITVVSRDDQPSYGVLLQDTVRHAFQLTSIHRFVDEQRIFLQYAGKNVRLALVEQTSFTQRFQKIVLPELLVGAEVIVSNFSFLGQPYVQSPCKK